MEEARTGPTPGGTVTAKVCIMAPLAPLRLPLPLIVETEARRERENSAPETAATTSFSTQKLELDPAHARTLFFTAPTHTLRDGLRDATDCARCDGLRDAALV